MSWTCNGFLCCNLGSYLSSNYAVGLLQPCKMIVTFKAIYFTIWSCFFLGPCLYPEETYTIDEITKQPKCSTKKKYRKFKRIFDVLPSKQFEANTLTCGIPGGHKCSTFKGSIADPRMGKRFKISDIIFSDSDNAKAIEFLSWLKAFAQ